ncbi:MAG: hypothetical protein ISS19_04505 [Bacteroidales bacterium]|nr:hypothetical protein [Bacteroidales bacterium]
MTAKELIRELQQLPHDTRIIIRGYEDGYNDILQLIPRSIVSHPGQKADYYGEYTDSGKENETGAIRAVELYGENTKAEGY